MSFKSHKKTITFTSYTLATVAAALVFAVGCDIFSPPPPGEEFRDEMTSPEKVCAAIEFAYGFRDINLYKKALSPNYVFYFNPSDVGQIVNGYEIPQSWTYQEDYEATKNMFSQAYQLKLDFITPMGEPEPNEETYYTQNKVINLLLMVDEQNGYRTDKGYCDFEFEKYYNSNNQPRWRLKKWYDHTSAS